LIPREGVQRLFNWRFVTRALGLALLAIALQAHAAVASDTEEASAVQVPLADSLATQSADAPLSEPVAVLSAAAQNVIQFFESVPGAKAVEEHLREAAELHGVDFYLLQALIATESGFNVRALSNRGAVGLMQIMPTTAARMGLSGDKKNPIRKKLQDPQTNIQYGTKYFATIQNMFTGRLDLALAAYNAGEGAVQRAGNQIPNINETRNFVKKVTDIYTSLKARALAQILPGTPVAEPAANTAVSLPPVPVIQ
jgi:soluble lytic murein transglycosylase-like protein